MTLAALQSPLPPSSRDERLPWPLAPAVLPFWFLWLGWNWWEEITVAMASLPGTARGTDAMAIVALAGRLAMMLTESAFYALWWRSRGTPLPFWRFFACVATFSGADLLAFDLGRAAEGAPEAVRMACAVLAGPAALDGAAPPASGAMVAFGGVGLLALLRVGLTGWAVARGTGRPLPGPMLFVVAVWIATRLASGWTFDLARGLSPLR